MRPDLSGRTAIVTGAAEGIGRTIAEHLGAAGAAIVVADVQAAAGTATVEALRDDGVDAAFVECDVSDPADAEAAVAAAADAFGSVDILVNNAAIPGGTTLLATDHATWERMLAVNLTGAFNCLRAAAPAMIEAGAGRVVNISSIAGKVISYTGSPAYTASKWGLVGLTMHAAWDLRGHDITVNAVRPGPTLIPRVREKLDAAAVEALEAKVPQGRWATAMDTAHAVAFLVSPGAGYVNGTTIDVDGGLPLGIRTEI